MGNFPSPRLSTATWEAAMWTPQPSLKARFPSQKAEAGAGDGTEGRSRGQQAHAAFPSCSLKATSGSKLIVAFGKALDAVLSPLCGWGWGAGRRLRTQAPKGGLEPHRNLSG